MSDFTKIETVEQLVRFQPVTIALLKRKEVSCGWVESIYDDDGVMRARIRCFDAQTIIFSGSNDCIHIDSPNDYLAEKWLKR